MGGLCWKPRRRILTQHGTVGPASYFSCDKSEELYSIVRDMMEHNTFGIADDLRRNGLLGVFLSVIADSAGVVAREEEDKGNQYVKKAVSLYPEQLL